MVFSFFRVLFIAVLFLGFSSPSFGFTLIRISGNTPVKSWKESTIEFGVNPDHCTMPENDFFALVDRAMELWNSVSTSGLKLKRGGSITSPPGMAFSGEAPENTYIGCSNKFSSDTGGKDPDFVAATTKLFIQEDLTLGKAAIILNTQPGKSANMSKFTDEKIAIILAHELGHAFGLGHTEAEKSLMYFSATERLDLTLSQDDMDGVAYLYPRSELGEDGVFGCGSLISGANLSGPFNGSELINIALFFVLAAIGTAISKKRSEPFHAQ